MPLPFKIIENLLLKHPGSGGGESFRSTKNLGRDTPPFPLKLNDPPCRAGELKNSALWDWEIGELSLHQ